MVLNACSQQPAQNSQEKVTGNTIKQECQEVQVPYEEQETYTETVPYEEQMPLRYDSSQSESYNCGSLFDYIVCYKVGVYNLDTVGGTFTTNCKIEALNREFSDSKQGYVKPGEWAYFECKANTNLGEDTKLTYHITPPTKSEMKYKDVQRIRTITKYKTEKKCN